MIDQPPVEVGQLPLVTGERSEQRLQRQPLGRVDQQIDDADLVNMLTQRVVDLLEAAGGGLARATPEDAPPVLDDDVLVVGEPRVGLLGLPQQRGFELRGERRAARGEPRFPAERGQLRSQGLVIDQVGSKVVVAGAVIDVQIPRQQPPADFGEDAQLEPDRPQGTIGDVRRRVDEQQLVPPLRHPVHRRRSRRRCPGFDRAHADRGERRVTVGEKKLQARDQRVLRRDRADVDDGEDVEEVLAHRARVPGRQERQVVVDAMQNQAIAPLDDLSRLVIEQCHDLVEPSACGQRRVTDAGDVAQQRHQGGGFGGRAELEVDQRLPRRVVEFPDVADEKLDQGVVGVQPLLMDEDGHQAVALARLQSPHPVGRVGPGLEHALLTLLLGDVGQGAEVLLQSRQPPGVLDVLGDVLRGRLARFPLDGVPEGQSLVVARDQQFVEGRASTDRQLARQRREQPIQRGGSCPACISVERREAGKFERLFDQDLDNGVDDVDRALLGRRHLTGEIEEPRFVYLGREELDATEVADCLLDAVGGALVRRDARDGIEFQLRADELDDGRRNGGRSREVAEALEALEIDGGITPGARIDPQHRQPPTFPARDREESLEIRRGDGAGQSGVGRIGNGGHGGTPSWGVRRRSGSERVGEGAESR